MDYNKATSFWIKRSKTFSVEVSAWESSGKWYWNVYAHVFDTHPKFEDDEWLKDLPFNGGCTLDKLIITQPFKIEYDFQGVNTTKKVGSDYAHIHDDYDNHPNPDDGIMYKAELDALELVKALEVNNAVIN